MKKTLLLAIMFVSIISVQAVVKVAYITFQKTMEITATTVQNDPIIQTLSADPNLAVTVKVLTAVAVGDLITDLDTYDVIIVQEPFNSAAGVLTTGGSLALKSIPKPFIYNKTYSLRNGKALATSSAVAADAAVLNITLGAGALTNDLFKACTISSSNEINLFVAGMTDTGGAGTKSLNYTTGNVISGSATLLAQPTGVTTAAIAINDIPAGTTIDSETTKSRMITFCMNTGAICGSAGKNITDDGLTIWRNAVYMLGGLPVPATKATLPSIGAGVNTLNNSSEVISVDYYNVNGIKVLDPTVLTNGIFVKRTTYQSGSVKSEKVVFVK